MICKAKLTLYKFAVIAYKKGNGFRLWRQNMISRTLLNITSIPLICSVYEYIMNIIAYGVGPQSLALHRTWKRHGTCSKGLTVHTNKRQIQLVKHQVTRRKVESHSRDKLFLNFLPGRLFSLHFGLLREPVFPHYKSA